MPVRSLVYIEQQHKSTFLLLRISSCFR